MNFDVQWFGYGAGLVLVGWFAGMVFSSVLNALSHGGR